MTAELMEHIRARVIFAVDKESEDGFISALLRHRIPACLRRDEEDGRLIAEISPKFTKKILSVLDNLSLKVYIINIKGFPALLPFLRHRIGAVLGVILFFALIWLSSLFVWRVEVVGAQRVPMETLVSGLREMGVGEGSRISGIDAYAVSNALLAAHPELSWTSIDITGTTVTLTVRETVVGEKDETGATSLMVASEDGVVESVLVYSGVAAVKPGCVVRAGDVLISGFISGSGLQYEDTPTLRVGKASGSVRAIVERSVTEYVPLHETVATDMGEGSAVQREITVFGRSFTLGDREPDGNSSVSVSERRVKLFGVIDLPITVRTTVWSLLTDTAVERDPETAEALARTRAEAAVTESVGAGELVSAEYMAVADGDGCTVTAEFRCLVEITLPMQVGNAADENASING